MGLQFRTDKKEKRDYLYETEGATYNTNSED